MATEPTYQPDLSGLLKKNSKARKRAYIYFALTALLVSFGPDIVMAGVLSDGVTPHVVAYIGLTSSLLLKIGTAFGFIAASNTSTK